MDSNQNQEEPKPEVVKCYIYGPERTEKPIAVGCELYQPGHKFVMANPPDFEEQNNSKEQK